MKDKKPTWKLELLTTALLVMAAMIVVMEADLGMGQSAGPNYRNYSARSTVNITNSFPEILAVVIDPDPITLNAGGQINVSVNVSVRDFDGFADIAGVNVTFFDFYNATSTSPDDNNNHYTNSSCFRYQQNGNLANYTCNFQVWYYANNGTWIANATTFDNFNFTDSQQSNATINQLLALNVTGVIDFGDLAVGDTSPSRIQNNATNFGNTLINVSVWGYGGTVGDGLAMVCEQRNITISNERYSINESLAHAAMTSLTGSNVIIQDLQLEQRLNDSNGGEVYNSTYWSLFIPPAENPAGQCNGTVVFQAEAI